MREQSRLRMTVFLLAIFMSLLLAGFVHRMMQPVIFSKEKLETYGGTVFEKPRIFRDPVLVDQHGQTLGKQFFLGKWTLVFFGFTYCPDICPTTMGMLNRFYGELQQKGEADGVQVLMVSVDPARDTPEKLRDYVAYFNPAFVGATGEYMDLIRFTADLNAGFTKVPTEDGNYLVEHSGNIVLINPRGDYHGFFRPPFDALRLHLAFNSVRAQYRRDFGQ